MLIPLFWGVPEVECISKGKAHKRYEFGVKVGLASTAKDNQPAPRSHQCRIMCKWL